MPCPRGDSSTAQWIMKLMDEREMIRRWVETWKRAGPELEAIRRKEIQEADNLKVLESLESAFNLALRQMPPRESSGMVEMQKYFAKLRTDD